MARTFIDVDQSEYVSLGDQYGSYGVHKNIFTCDIQALINEKNANVLNSHISLIHFNVNHVDENNVPTGNAHVLQVKWAFGDESSRGPYPYVRVRALPFGAVGDTKTPRTRLTLSEIYHKVK